MYSYDIQSQTNIPNLKYIESLIYLSYLISLHRVIIQENFIHSMSLSVMKKKKSNFLIIWQET